MPVDLIILLGTYLMCWQGYKMRRKVNGLGHVAVVLSLIGTLANSVTARLSGAHPHGALAAQSISVVEHIFVVISCAGLYVFRLAVEGHTLRDRRVQVTIGGALAVSAAFVTLAILAARRGPLLSISVESFRDPRGFIYNFGGGLYYGLTMLLIAQWMIRCTRGEEKHFKRGMRLAAVGLYTVSALCIGRAVPVAITFLGGPPVVAPPFLLGTVSAAAFPLVFLGLSYPIIVSRWAAYRAWTHEERDSARVNVVWQTCTVAYPEIVLRPGSVFERLRQALWKPARLRRRRTETFDGLAKLLFVTSKVEPSEQAGAAADSLRVAVRRYDETHDRAVRDVISPAAESEREGVPAKPDGDTETHMLLALAELLHDTEAMTRAA